MYRKTRSGADINWKWVWVTFQYQEQVFLEPAFKKQTNPVLKQGKPVLIF